jgi:CRISPR-associated protein Csh1
MIQAIMKIGQWVEEMDGTKGSIQNFVQNPNEKGNIRKVLTITLDKQDDSWIYKDVEIEEFRQKYLAKYLYRHGSSSGADITPTSKFAGDMKKTFKKKIVRSIDDISREAENLGLDSKEIEQVEKIHEALFAAEIPITERLIERSEEIERREGAIITLVFQENGKRKYIGDIDLFHKVLMSKAKEKYFKQYGKKSLGNNQMCSVCQKQQTEVYGFVNTYNFYTVDKPGFVSGGFKQQNAWKNYPVCFECASNLELGKKYLNEKLRFSFFGFRYLLIPKFFSDSIMEKTLDVLEDMFEHRATEMIEAGFDQTYINRLTDAEDEIFDLIAQEKDYVSFDLLFYREKQSAFNILLHVEDILPSRFRRLFEIKARLDAIDIFRKEVSKKDGKRLLIFNFRILRSFFPYVSKTRSYDKHFLELVGKIFSLKPVEYHFIMKAIVTKLRSRFVNDEYTKIDCLSGYLLLNYLGGLGILRKGGVGMEIKLIEDLKESFGSEDTSVSQKTELFFEAHGGFFDNAAKKACFLVGILAQKLINIQLQEKKATPFRTKLHGLRLTEPLLKKISYEAQNKLEQYKKNYYRELEGVIAQYMVAGGPAWSLTNDEISFYFTMGMNLASLFKSKKEENDNDRPEQ